MTTIHGPLVIQREHVLCAKSDFAKFVFHPYNLFFFKPSTMSLVQILFFYEKFAKIEVVTNVVSFDPETVSREVQNCQNLLN